MASRLAPPPADPFVKTDEPLLWLSSGGRESRDASYFFDTRRRSERQHVVFQLTLGGCGFYQRGNHRTLVPARHAWIDRIPGTFRYGHTALPGRPAGERYELVYVSFTGPVALRWMRRLHKAFGPVLDFGSDRSVAEMMTAIVARYETGPARVDRYLASAQLYALLMQTWSVLTRSRLQLEPRVEEALTLINERAGRPEFSVEDMAKILACSREHMTRQFHRATGMTPSAYLTQHRLRLATRALRRSDDKIEAVARRCGFNSANYLCRVFRQRWRITPAQYRRAGVELLLD